MQTVDDTVDNELLSKFNELTKYVKTTYSNSIKINNIVTEIENICETTQDIALLEKIKQIPSLTLKYVATNQSLYI